MSFLLIKFILILLMILNFPFTRWTNPLILFYKVDKPPNLILQSGQTPHILFYKVDTKNPHLILQSGHNPPQHITSDCNIEFIISLSLSTTPFIFLFSFTIHFYLYTCTHKTSNLPLA